MPVEPQRPPIIYHIAEKQLWQASVDDYRPDGFAGEGFVHLSTAEQVLLTAQRYYAGRTDLCLLAVAVERLAQPVVYENLLGGDDLFPHYYGALPLAAVVDEADLQWLGDGRFRSRLLQP